MPEPQRELTEGEKKEKREREIEERVRVRKIELKRRLLAPYVALEAGLPFNAGWLMLLPREKDSEGRDVIQIGDDFILLEHLIALGQTTEGRSIIGGRDIGGIKSSILGAGLPPSRGVSISSAEELLRTEDPLLSPEQILQKREVLAQKEAFERTPEFAIRQFEETRPELESIAFLKGKEGTVPERQFRFMRSIFPDLMQKFQETLQKLPERTFPGAKGTGFGFPQTWAEFIKKYPFEQEFSALTPEQRGFRGGFQPLIRQVGR